MVDLFIYLFFQIIAKRFYRSTDLLDIRFLRFFMSCMFINWLACLSIVYSSVILESMAILHIACFNFHGGLERQTLQPFWVNGVNGTYCQVVLYFILICWIVYLFFCLFSVLPASFSVCFPNFVVLISSMLRFSVHVNLLFYL